MGRRAGRAAGEDSRVGNPSGGILEFFDSSVQRYSQGLTECPGQRQSSPNSREKMIFTEMFLEDLGNFLPSALHEEEWRGSNGISFYSGNKLALIVLFQRIPSVPFHPAAGAASAAGELWVDHSLHKNSPFP